MFENKIEFKEFYFSLAFGLWPLAFGRCSDRIQIQSLELSCGQTDLLVLLATLNRSSPD